MLGKNFQANLRSRWTGQQAVEHIRELFAQAERSHQAGFALGHGLEDGVERSLDLLFSTLAQGTARVPRGIAELHHHVRDGVVIELVQLGRQLEPPAADDARAFERQVALITEVELEQAGVILSTAGGNRLNANQIVNEALIFEAAVCVLRTIGSAVFAHRAAEQGQLGANAGVRARDARNRQAHRADAPEVLAREIQIEEHFRQVELAGSRFTQILQGATVDDGQGDRLLDLQLTLVAFEERHIHALQVVDQLFTREQALVQTIDVAELDEAVVHPQLELKGALGGACGVERQLVHGLVRAIERRDHELVQVDVGELIAQEIQRLLRLFTLDLVVLQLLLRDIQADVGDDDLLIQLVDLQVRL